MEDEGGHYTLTGEEIDEVYDKMRDNVAPDEMEEDNDPTGELQEEFCN